MKKSQEPYGFKLCPFMPTLSRVSSLAFLWSLNVFREESSVTYDILLVNGSAQQRQSFKQGEDVKKRASNQSEAVWVCLHGELTGDERSAFEWVYSRLDESFGFEAFDAENDSKNVLAVQFTADFQFAA